MCLSVCVYVWAITFECLDIETSFLVWQYILTISRSSLRIKVIGSMSRSLWQLASWTVGHQISLLWPAYSTDVVIKVKVISQSRLSQGHSHFEVKIIQESNGNVFQFLSWSRRLAFVQMLIFLVFYTNIQAGETEINKRITYILLTILCRTCKRTFKFPWNSDKIFLTAFLYKLYWQTIDLGDNLPHQYFC